MRALIAGNWKMNGLQGEISHLRQLQSKLDARRNDSDILICPPATLIRQFAVAAEGSVVKVGAQDCHRAQSGAHTGDLSAEMLADAGAQFVIVGHSERRADHGETNEAVREKAIAVLRAGLTPIICVGETRGEREAGNALDVVGAQLEGSLPEHGKNCVIAYEPVWAIGTGLTPTLDDIGAMHDFLRAQTNADWRLLYGGSVKPENASEILQIDNVNGALVGGASLKADDFFGIICAAQA